MTWNCASSHFQARKPQGRQANQTNPVDTACTIDLRWFLSSSMTIFFCKFTILICLKTCTVQSFSGPSPASLSVAPNCVLVCSTTGTLTSFSHLHRTTTLPPSMYAHGPCSPLINQTVFQRSQPAWSSSSTLVHSLFSQNVLHSPCQTVHSTHQISLASVNAQSFSCSQQPYDQFSAAQPLPQRNRKVSFKYFYQI